MRRLSVLKKSRFMLIEEERRYLSISYIEKDRMKKL